MVPDLTIQEDLGSFLVDCMSFLSDYCSKSIPDSEPVNVAYFYLRV